MLLTDSEKNDFQGTDCDLTRSVLLNKPDNCYGKLVFIVPSLQRRLHTSAVLIALVVLGAGSQAPAWERDRIGLERAKAMQYEKIKPTSGTVMLNLPDRQPAEIQNP